ncbi:amidohydrolase family protein [Desulfurivibrio alkaliphilus]|uniref:Amidohydrolase n=1 Tax=Desulfurivibrio alkaliphilus (strain DSM 19089 / UNIQEM U267 / AHT2) TaxID=589865 RepID=D6Z0P5_DESAT|nr:amidohydrolase family protein [Desulfurivibrio alkaliphilus]ADH85274.1 amidohydrolase [Desulfurivibrio alkaliphilus AHT 2]
MAETIRLYRAPLILPVAAPPLCDGAVLTADGRVRAVGPYPEVRRLAETLPVATEVDYEGHVLIPALVNAHCHLELSGLAFLSRQWQPAPGDITGWIRRLLAAREERPADPDAALLALARLFAGGCRTVLDIGNEPGSAAIGRQFKVEVFFYLELLGFSGAAQEAALVRLAEQPAELCCTGHAPYSTGPELFRALKKRAAAASCRLPVHVAESVAEEEFLAHGGGPLRDFLQERGLDLAAYRPPGCSAVAWLDRLGLLDEQTICVHGVQVSREDIARLAARRAGVCLCPGSNRYLGVGRAPLPAYLEAGIMPALGTDSQASNHGFSLWHEMKVLREDHPEVEPATVLAMATMAGARLLGRESETGVIAPGVASALPAVVCPDAASGPEKVLEYLTTAGEDIRLEWIE